jgi:hypothetical protein
MVCEGLREGGRKECEEDGGWKEGKKKERRKESKKARKERRKEGIPINDSEFEGPYMREKKRIEEAQNSRWW